MRNRPYSGLTLGAAVVAAASIAEMTDRGLFYPVPARPKLRRSRNFGVPYHRPGVDTVLMDWDLPKGKRAKRRARGRRLKTSQDRGGA